MALRELLKIFNEEINEMDSWPENGVWKCRLSWSIYESIKDMLIELGFEKVSDEEMIFGKDDRKIVVYCDDIWNEI